jgi:uncharacterized protein YkwD
MKKRLVFIIFILFFFLFLTNGCIELREKFEPQDISAIEQAIFRETNFERVKYGLKPLGWNDKLAMMAKDHSLDMLINSYFSHVNLEGETPSDRALKYDIPEKKPLGGGFYLVGVGENIGEISPGNIANLGGIYVQNTPQGLSEVQVLLWMNSLEHRENILNGNYTEIGIGTVYNHTTQNYINTQNFR